MTDAECERKIALLEASWAYLDETGSPRVAGAAQGSARRRPRAGRDRPPRRRLGDLRPGAEGRRRVRRSRPARTRTRCAPTAPRSWSGSATTTPGARWRGRGTSSSSSDAARGTCSTTPGRWRTATRPPRAEAPTTRLPPPGPGPRAPTRGPSRAGRSGGSGTGSATSGHACPPRSTRGSRRGTPRRWAARPSESSRRRVACGPRPCATSARAR